MSAGYCSWHKGMADDVALIVIDDHGSGAGGGAYACLSCARPMAGWWTTPRYAQDAIAELEKRAAATAGARGVGRG